MELIIYHGITCCNVFILGSVQTMRKLSPIDQVPLRSLRIVSTNLSRLATVYALPESFNDIFRHIINIMTVYALSERS